MVVRVWVNLTTSSGQFHEARHRSTLRISVIKRCCRETIGNKAAWKSQPKGQGQGGWQL